MNRKIGRSGALFLLLALAAAPRAAEAQVLVTGETGGKGAASVLVTGNGLFPEGLRLFNAYVQAGYGVSDRLDAFVSYGNITALGRTQHYAGVGGNLRLVRREHAFVDVSTFHSASVPLSRRAEASTLLLNSALIASRPVRAGARTLSLYTGANFTIPIGARRDKLFTPPETFVNLPIGVSTTLAGKWVIYLEVDAGPGLKSAGVGLLRGF